jgi:hypothetical protein
MEAEVLGDGSLRSDEVEGDLTLTDFKAKI